MKQEKEKNKVSSVIQ